MNCHSSRILPPGASRKRKEREAFYSVKPSSASAQPQLPAQLAYKPGDGQSVSSNGLLAGYMAYEFLTKGTILGEKFDPARAEAVPLAAGSAEWKRGGGGKAEPGRKKEQRNYAEVASILKTDGAHIPGIVNPTQLARWIQM